MRSDGLNRKIAPPHFHHKQFENHAGTAFGSRWRDPLRAGKPSSHRHRHGGADTLEGFTFIDAIGKAGGELSEERLANCEEGALDGWREDLRLHLADDFCEPGIEPDRIESRIDGEPRKLGLLVLKRGR